MYSNRIMMLGLYLALKFLKSKKKGKGIGRLEKGRRNPQHQVFQRNGFFKQEKYDPEIHHLVNLSDILSNIREPI